MATRSGASDAVVPDARAIFEILVREHADMLEVYLRAIVRSEQAVDDLFQEVMLVAWRRLGEYDKAHPFAAWLRGIARVLVMEHHRKARARPRTIDPATLTMLDARFEALERQPGSSFAERAERLLICMERLPQAMREAIQAVYSRGASIGAAASAMGVSIESVKKRVQRGREALADCLGASEPRG